MRILISGSTYAPQLNGQAIFTAGLARGLAARGHTIRVLIPRMPGDDSGSLDQRISTIRLPSLRLRIFDDDLYLPTGSRATVKAQLDDFQPDVVHVQDASPACQALVREAKRRHIPVIMTHHPGPEITAPYLTTANPIVRQVCTGLGWAILLRHLARADLVTVPSRASQDMLTRKGLARGVLTVPCFVRLDEFTHTASVDRAAVRDKYGLAPNAVVLLYAGRIDIEKRVDVLIRAATYRDLPGVQIAVVGRGAQEVAMRRLATNLNIGDKIHFLGEVSHGEIPGLLHAADLFAMPGDAESFSIATLEAMACGKPVLASNSPALAELISHGTTGYLFRPNDAHDAAKGIRTLLEWRDAWPTMGSRNIKKARNYGLERIVETYEHTYRRLQDRRARLETLRLPSSAPEAHQRRRPAFRPVALLTLGVLFSLLALVLTYDQMQASSILKLDDLVPVNVREIERLLVIAPHPDDEILGAGGLTQAVRSSGGQVRVVIVTNGDGQWAGPVLASGRPPAPASYIELGERRQVESLAALKALGVGASQVDFLGYPDGKLEALWRGAWDVYAPVTGPYTRVTSNPYAQTLRPSTVYQGGNLYDDLVFVMKNFAPDLILAPHPEDSHGDHRAVSNFVQLAASVYSADMVHKPSVLGYLVHYRGYPVPRGTDLSRPLLPPAALSRGRDGWLTYILSPEERRTKLMALRTHATQQQLSSRYLNSFARANEVFFSLPLIELHWIDYQAGDTFSDLAYDTRGAEAGRETFAKTVAASADLVAWKVMQIGRRVCFGAETRGPSSEALQYYVLVRLPGGRILQVSRDDEAFLQIEQTFGACFDLEELDDPPALGFAAEVRSGLLFDRTTWHFVVPAAPNRE